VKEIYRDRRGIPAFETLSRDLAHALRTLRHHPGYTWASMASYPTWSASASGRSVCA
jgi:hypothetical protein